MVYSGIMVIMLVNNVLFKVLRQSRHLRVIVVLKVAHGIIGQAKLQESNHISNSLRLPTVMKKETQLFGLSFFFTNEFT
jgi:hypothetical protein